jgi:hypothetical protein
MNLSLAWVQGHALVLAELLKSLKVFTRRKSRLSNFDQRSEHLGTETR